VRNPLGVAPWLAQSLSMAGCSVSTAEECLPKLIVVDLDISEEDWRQASHSSPQLRGLEKVILRLVTEFETCPLCRCVNMSRLDAVLRTGIDVEPSDQAFWADPFLSEALPHGGDPKLLIVLDRGACQESLRRVVEGMTKAELKALLRDYPFPVIDPTLDGRWVSRLPDRRASRHREGGQGFWIPGDAQKALLAAVVLTTRESRPKAHRILEARGAELKSLER
jgi:hypothetical protein